MKEDTMQIVSGFHPTFIDPTLRLSFLNCWEDGGGPIWHEIRVGQNSRLGLPYPGYFRLSPKEMEVEYTEGYTTWDLRYESDDGVPDWRTVYVTKVASWATDKGTGRALVDRLHEVQVKLLVVTQYDKEHLERIWKDYPAEEHDILVRFFNPPQTRIEATPCRESLYALMAKAPPSKQGQAEEVLAIIEAGKRTYITGDQIADVVAPVISTEILQAQVSAMRGVLRREEEKREEEKNQKVRQIQEHLKEMSTYQLDNLLFDLEGRGEEVTVDDIFDSLLD